VNTITDLTLGQCGERWGLSSRNSVKARAKVLGVPLRRESSTRTVWPAEFVALGDQLHQHLGQRRTLADFVEPSQPRSALCPWTQLPSGGRRMGQPIAPGETFVVRAQCANQWGDWEFMPNLTLWNERLHYEVDLENINTAGQMLDWIFHLRGRLGEEGIWNLLQAFEDILHPRKNCCSFGAQKVFSGRALALEYARQLNSRPKRTPIPARTRFEVLHRAGHTCQSCGAKASGGAQLHIDHIHPVSKGGTNDLANLQALCRDCNLGKGDRIL